MRVNAKTSATGAAGGLIIRAQGGQAPVGPGRL